MNAKGLYLFGLLALGSVYFLVYLVTTAKIRGVFALGLYMVFVAMVFGVHLLLQPEPRRQQPDEKPSATDKDS
jgi:hypothetical protein